MEEKKKIPFPQANDFNKIIKIVEIDDESKLEDNKFLMNLLDLGTERQVSYYLSACEFLGLVNKRKLTDVAYIIRNNSYETKILSYSNLIVSKPVFGETFFYYFYYNKNISIDEIAQLIAIYYDIENYSVCLRRASTVINWINWIIEEKIMFN